MGTYHENEVRKVIEDSHDGYYKIKIIGMNTSTNWMNITKHQLEKIKKILR